MRICRARFETLGSNQRRLSNKRQQDSLTPLQKKKPVSSVSKEDEPIKTRVTTSVHLCLTAQTSSGTFLYSDIPYRCNRRILSQPWHDPVLRCASRKPSSPYSCLSPLSPGRLLCGHKIQVLSSSLCFLCVMLTYSLKFVNTLFCEFKRLHIFQGLPQNEVLCHHILHEDSDRSSGLKRLK